jgi:hydroxypyruvate reductase
MNATLRRSHLDQIRAAALEAVEPAAAVRRFLFREDDRLRVGVQVVPLHPGRQVRLVGAGKAAVPMARAAAALLGKRLGPGVVVTKYGHLDGSPFPPGVKAIEAGHPVPDDAGLEAVAEIEALLGGLNEEDVVLALFSGGASALLPDPAPGITLADLQATTGALLRSGAPIGEVNAVRKHLSRLKGGQLARLAHPAAVATLILSDVVGDPLDVIASGPTAPDPTTFADAWGILERRGLLATVPPAVRRRLRDGVEGQLPDTPGPGDPAFARVLNVLVGSNRLAAEAAVSAAQRLGYQALLLSTFVEGEAREVAKLAVSLAKEILASNGPVRTPACLVLGGETTVTVRGGGRGGRNQEIALAAALALEGIEGASILALATDGTDGPTDAAGGIADGGTSSAIRAAGIDPAAALRENDSYPALEAGRALLRTGPTGTNVNDLLVILVGDTKS